MDFNQFVERITGQREENIIEIGTSHSAAVTNLDKMDYVQSFEEVGASHSSAVMNVDIVDKIKQGERVTG